MRKKITTKATKEKAHKGEFLCVLESAGLKTKIEGDTIIDCLDKLAGKSIKTKGVLTISKGKVARTTILYPLQMRKLVVPMFRIVLAKRLGIYF